VLAAGAAVNAAADHGYLLRQRRAVPALAELGCFKCHTVDGAPLLAMAVAVIFIVTLLGFVFGDVVFRFPPSRPDRMGEYAWPPIGELPVPPRRGP